MYLLLLIDSLLFKIRSFKYLFYICLDTDCLRISYNLPFVILSKLDKYLQFYFSKFCIIPHSRGYSIHNSFHLLERRDRYIKLSIDTKVFLCICRFFFLRNSVLYRLFISHRPLQHILHSFQFSDANRHLRTRLRQSAQIIAFVSPSPQAAALPVFNENNHTKWLAFRTSEYFAKST